MRALYLMGLLACGTAHGAPMALVDPNSTQYASVDAAALGALQDVPGGYEYGGAIARCAGAYVATAPVTSGDSAEIEVRVGLPAGCVLAGIYHTHPGIGEDSLLFSAHDVSVAMQLGVPSYIRFAHSGRVRRFTPGVSKVSAHRASGFSTGSGAAVAAGESV